MPKLRCHVVVASGGNTNGEFYTTATLFTKKILLWFLLLLFPAHIPGISVTGRMREKPHANVREGAAEE